MKIFFSGGCKNGKSTLAERSVKALAGDGPLYYIATMIPHDEEDEERIRRHVASRAGMGFQTLEQGRNVLRCLDHADPGGAFLLDSVTALLSNEMFLPDGSMDQEAGNRLSEELAQLAAKVKHIVFVSDYIYADSGLYDSFTEDYRKALACCDRALARVCDTVVEVFSTNPILYKGALPF
jgi:adenosylcobinamide kinase/adenosylcobinamide-phosphate guanylyltransferase